MDKKTLLREIGYKLRKLRDSLRYKVGEMADSIGNERTSYNRYEQGKTPPKLMTLYRLAETYDISLDWLIRNKGPMYCKEKETGKTGTQPTLDSLSEDLKELLVHLQKIPLLRYEVLTLFYKFKEKNKEMVAAAVGTQEEG